jgi:phosphoadenosine phosphosulfate reductase
LKCYELFLCLEGEMAIDKEISEKRKRQCEKLIELSKAIVKETLDKFKYDDIGITWTGGKDSSLTLWIIRQICKEKGIHIPKTMIIEESWGFLLNGVEMKTYSRLPITLWVLSLK